MTEQNIKTRDEIQSSDKWDLSSLFTHDSQWEKALDELASKIDGYLRFNGRLKESAAVFKDAIEFDLQISREFEKIHTYAHLKNDEDRTNNHYKEMYERSLSLHTKIAEISSFLVPEMHSLPRELADSYVQDSLLAEYRVYAEKIFRFRAHTRSEEVEKILAMAGEVHHAPSEIFSQLDNADMKFGIVETDKGEKVELSHGNFSSFLQSRNREIRKKVFFQYYKSYDDHKHTIAAAFASSIKKDRFYGRVRNFPSALDAALFGEDVPLKVYENLISSVRSNAVHHKKYLNYRKKYLGLDELHFYDTYVPLVDGVEVHMPYDEAVDTCIKALAPLGSSYTNVLKEGLTTGWVDRYENRGKRSGAYSSGCFDSPPYILMNYREDNINSLYTLIHEAGHSMHSYCSHKTQPYHYADYTIFVAEVASTFNETLLSHYLLEKNKNNRDMRSYILNREIDNIRATLFRQTMFAEFEKIIHEKAERDEPITLDSICRDYRSLLDAYFGGAIVIDRELELEGLRIPHFYHAFYVYKYATGISAAIALAKKVLEGNAQATSDYLKFLSLGGSLFPIDELKTAGVDMSRRESVDDALSHFSTLVDNLIDS
jgi:oligoendopeptidase F